MQFIKKYLIFITFIRYFYAIAKMVVCCKQYYQRLNNNSNKNKQIDSI